MNVFRKLMVRAIETYRQVHPKRDALWHSSPAIPWLVDQVPTYQRRNGTLVPDPR